jgi:Mn-dependent DtxR family transcriptional regulator
MGEWSFLTNHARVLACIAQDPGVRIRDIAATLDIAERNAFGIVRDLTSAGYVLKDKDGRRNRYGIQVHVPLRRDGIQVHVPLRRDTDRHQTIGELLAVLVDTKARGDLQQGVDVKA